MKNIISLVGIIAVLGVAAGEARGVAMNANIRRLLQEKQDKVAKLEECEGKKQGWMIAGISTIGLTAVGVGVNIAQASKSNRLSGEIDASKYELERKQSELNRVNEKISDKKAEKAEEERKRAEEEERMRNATNGNNGGIETSGVDGAIGEKCNDDKGVWFTAIEGNNKKCSNSAGEIVDCKCVENVTPTLGQGSGGGDKPVEKPKASETNGRVVGGACIGEDIEKLKPYGWESGTYIRVSESANSNTLLKARCETKSGKGDNVPCNCKATACDTEKGYEANPNSNGLCVKAEKKEEPKSKGATLDASVDGTDYCYYDIDGDDSRGGISGCNNPGDWGVSFPDYTVYGTAVCNNNAGKSAQASSSEQTEAGGKECWCKMKSPKESRWVFGSSVADASRCADNCAAYCAYFVKDASDFRGGVFGSVK